MALLGVDQMSLLVLSWLSIDNQLALIHAVHNLCHSPLLLPTCYLSNSNWKYHSINSVCLYIQYNTTKMPSETEMAEARAKMIAKRFGSSSGATTGGKGTVRRKKKAASRSSSAQSDVKLNAALKKLGATNIPGIEEVNFFKDDGKVIHFVNPKVQASIAANTYIVSGAADTKPLQDLLPSIVSQLGMDNISQLQAAMAGQQGAMGGASIPEGGEDDDDVPDLVDGNFEEVSES